MSTICVVAEGFSEGLPLATWVVVGDKSSRSLESRIRLAYTLIIFQGVLGLIVSVKFVSATANFADGFVPAEVRAASLTYVPTSTFSALRSALEAAGSSDTRALDHPDVPLLVRSIKFAVNIMVDLILISRFHVRSGRPSVNTQASIRLACEMASAFVGLLYFIYISSFRGFVTSKRNSSGDAGLERSKPSFKALKVLGHPGFVTFLESAIRNALYLWLVSSIISMGVEYATAWGIFNTIRRELIMVPVQTLEASLLAFISHRWGAWKQSSGIDCPRPATSRRDLFSMLAQ